MFIKYLRSKGLVTAEQIEDARDRAVGAKKPVHDLLVEMDFISEEDFLKAAVEYYQMPVTSLDEEQIDPSCVNFLSYDRAKKYGVFPFRMEDGKLLIAMTNPYDVITLDDLRIITGKDLKPVLSSKKDISNYIEEYYKVDDAIYDLLKNIVTDTKIVLVQRDKSGRESYNREELQGERSPIIRLVNLILSEAVKSRASDVHIEPYDDFARVRYRIDGYLKNIMKIPNSLYPSLVSRIKIVSSLDITEKAKTQDGRIQMIVGDNHIDLRISIVPTLHGEKLAIRILDAREAKVDISVIGFRQEELDVFNKAIRKSQGMILITGPTGSGKTSTIYAALNSVKSEKSHIITIEDPVEYRLEGINQIQVNPTKDVTFANGLRSILRQDPNVVLVGEIRDAETADIAFRASLTGHLVFSTLHTNDAIATIVRLLDIGLEASVISSALSLVVAQRLVRKICPHCKEIYYPDRTVGESVGHLLERFNVEQFYRGKGCAECGYVGYMGRTAIFEILKIDDKIKNIISSAEWSEKELLRYARGIGFNTLLESGIRKVAEGITTVEEVLKVVDVGEREMSYINEPALSDKSKILIVDDETDFREILNKRIKDAGYDVLNASDGREGVDITFREHPDLIIMDVMMPGMDGFEATKILRSQLKTASIPIIMLTAKSDKRSELEGLNIGADDYLTKPCDHEKLLARIKMLLARRRLAV
ncbi:MAG: Type II secretion system protein E [Elusimicrobia bacterium ADurb.Bin231]|nr:MAG: Type II secretion system protein E [Elusimicrobia bacterium ADurb.Bin231]